MTDTTDRPASEPDAAPAAAAPDLDRLADALGGVLRGRLGGDGRIELVETIAGNVNTIYKIRYAGRHLGVRVTHDPYRFRYEKDIVKEIFAIFLIYFAKAEANDVVAQGIVDGILRSAAGSHINHSWVRSIVHYDWSKERLPYPFFIYEWAEGEPLWRDPAPDQYAGAGRDLARLHRIRFESYYEDIFRIGREPLDWESRFSRAYEGELRAARPRLSPALAGRLAALDAGRIPPGPPSLVHNDYAGGNIIVELTGARKIIDWDNWVVEAPELDLVKMKYWTAIGADGRLAHDPARYAAFLDGYGDGGGAAPDPARLRAYEALWLLRVYNFECARREADGVPSAETSWSRHYPPAAAYEDYLGGL